MTFFLLRKFFAVGMERLQILHQPCAKGKGLTEVSRCKKCEVAGSSRNAARLRAKRAALFELESWRRTLRLDLPHRTTIAPRNMFIPQVNLKRPDLFGVNCATTGISRGNGILISYAGIR